MSGGRNDGLLRLVAAIVAAGGHERTIVELSTAAEISPKQARDHLAALQAKKLVRSAGAPSIPGRRGPPGYVYRWEPRR